MTDGIIKGTGNSRYLRGAGWPTTYEEFKSMAEAGTLPFDLNGINEAGWQQVGDALNKGNLLSDESALKLFSSPSGNETVNQVLSLLSGAALAPYETIGDKAQGYSMSVGGFEFVKVTDNYNGVSGNTLMLCKTGLSKIAWSASKGAYSGGTLDAYLTGTYYDSLPSAIKSIAKSADISAYSGATNATSVTTIQRKVFAASRAELFNLGADGTNISGFSDLIESGTYKWTRTPYSTSVFAYTGYSSSSPQDKTYTGSSAIACIVIPSTYKVSWSITDVFGQLLTIPSSQLDERLRIAAGSYTGTGTSGPTSLNTTILPFTPEILVVQAKGVSSDASNPQLMIAIRGILSTPILYHRSTYGLSEVFFTWNEQTVSWHSNNVGYGETQLNSGGKTYLYVAIGKGIAS